METESSVATGTLGMVESALECRRDRGVVDLDQDRRAVMVSNLMTVLCSEQATHPVVNVGSSY